MANVFISYSHTDEAWKDQLATHLKTLEIEGFYQSWDDAKIEPGSDWRGEIETALNRAQVAVMLISADFLASQFITEVEVPLILKRRQEQGLIVLPVIVKPCALTNIQWLLEIQHLPRGDKAISEMQPSEIDRALAGVAQTVCDCLGNRKKPAVLSGDHISLYKLPVTGDRLFGREKELKQLDDAWADGQTDILTLVAWGGVGKTALVNQWLNQMKTDNYRGAQKVYGWSFYSQGAQEGKQASADEFFQETLQWLGDANPEAGSAVDKGRRLARLARQQKALLILDGLEPLQYPPGEIHGFNGKLKDAGLAAFLKELACGNTGSGAQKVLCVITTREPVTDLLNRKGYGVTEIPLEHLSEEAGKQLLKSLGVTIGSQKDFHDAVTEYGGHALALTLLGQYIANILDGDIRKRDEIVKSSKGKIKEGHHAQKVMEAYDRWFKENKSENRSTKLETNPNVQKTNDQNKNSQTDASKQTVSNFKHLDFGFVSDFDIRASDFSLELNILYIIGLFDRPVEAGAIEALKKKPAISGVTDKLQGITGADWQMALSHLRNAHLLAKEDQHKKGTLDCHPLVREYFGEKLRQENPAGWKKAHERLYQYFKDLPEKKLPDTLAEMEPLFAAVAHGCQAGQHQEALDEVYWKRIKRGNEHYCTKKLGAFGSDLACLSHFFAVPWGLPAVGLTEADKAVVLSWAAFRLRALGRLREASQAMEATLERYKKMQDPKEIAIAASNLSELLLTLGDVKEAVAAARQSVTYADQSGDENWKYASRTTLADALHQAGELKEAEQWFREAEEMQKKRQPEYPFLYSVRGYKFCDLLLENHARVKGQIKEVMERAEKTLKWALQQGNLLLDIALNYLTLGRAWMRWALGVLEETPDEPPQSGRLSRFSRAMNYLDQAVEGLRKAGQQQYLTPGLIIRAEGYRHIKEYEKALDDLCEARDIAELGEMKLFICDYHLEFGRLCHAQGKMEEAAEHVQAAKAIVEETGYFRRKKEKEIINYKL